MYANRHYRPRSPGVATYRRLDAAKPLESGLRDGGAQHASARRVEIRLAGALAEAFDVEDLDGARLDAEPAALGEVGQGLVDRLT